jgi:hypothetical protein
MTGSNSSHGTELMTLLAAVAASPIVAPARPRHFADWCRMQKGADIDGLILAWIASQVPARRPTALT